MPHILKLLSCKRGGGVARYTTGPKQASNIHSLTAKHKSTFVQLCATGYPWPDRTFRSFSASKPADWQILRCLETAIYGFWGAEIVKCSVGSNPKKVFHQHRPPSSDVSCLVCLSGLELKKAKFAAGSFENDLSMSPDLGLVDSISWADTCSTMLELKYWQDIGQVSIFLMSSIIDGPIPSTSLFLFVLLHSI